MDVNGFKWKHDYEAWVDSEAMHLHEAQLWIDEGDIERAVRHLIEAGRWQSIHISEQIGFLEQGQGKHPVKESANG